MVVTLDQIIEAISTLDIDKLNTMYNSLYSRYNKLYIELNNLSKIKIVLETINAQDSNKYKEVCDSIDSKKIEHYKISILLNDINNAIKKIKELKDIYVEF